MEAEKDEATKRYNNRLSLWNITLVVEIVAVVAITGYLCLPVIINFLQAVIILFRLVQKNIFFVFVLVNALIGLIYVLFCKTTEINKPDLYDQYFTAAPTVFRPSPVDFYRLTEVGDSDDGYCNKEIVPAFQAVETVKDSNCYDRVVMEVNSKSYRRTRSEKKARLTVEYRRTESERVTKTASWRSQTMEDLSSEEFRMTVDTFITKKKKMLLQQNGVVDQ